MPAAARDLWPSADGAHSLELGAFYKTLGTALWMQPGLVDASRALAELMEETRAALPPEQAQLLPPSRVLPAAAASSAHAARLWTRLFVGEWLEAQGRWIVNKEHGQQFQAEILRTMPPTTVEGIEKAIRDTPALLRDEPVTPTAVKAGRVAPSDLPSTLARLRREMQAAAEALEFERAAELRDQLKKLRESVFLSPL